MSGQKAGWLVNTWYYQSYDETPSANESHDDQSIDQAAPPQWNNWNYCNEHLDSLDDPNVKESAAAAAVAVAGAIGPSPDRFLDRMEWPKLVFG